eukprot:CAMPEP_0182910604 /NCGR_PEP_ID=MMETSP0034_2-20130328/36422_1 /TAXON_ID=156128 /ORGANISM="Nephroselmis pyriformis, Strain CCMP717" /LENGTH=65 /DNA_ID=CAMNT_0025046989 /DNA_START=64 /DNA_END=258 /DNA_ORIENTATION=+
MTTSRTVRHPKPQPQVALRHNPLSSWSKPGTTVRNDPQSSPQRMPLAPSREAPSQQMIDRMLTPP